MSAPSFSRRSALLLGLSALALSGCNTGGGGGGGADGPMTLGKDDAPVTVVEYASVACHACAAWHEEVWGPFKAKYIDTGLVKFELREMLTGDPRIAAAGFLMARCAGRERYFDVVNALYPAQDEMGRTGDVRGVLLRTAQSAGMTEAQFESCITDEKALLALNERHDQAIAAGVGVTPTFKIGDATIVGAQGLAEFDRVIQPMLKQRGG